MGVRSPVGLFAAKSARLMGKGRVIVIDHLEYWLDKVRSFAHAETYNFTEYDDIVVEMKKTTDYLAPSGIRQPPVEQVQIEPIGSRPA